MNEQPERFTNDWYEVLTEVKSQMTAIDPKEAGVTLLVYVEYLFADYVSIHYIAGEENKLVIRKWEQGEDLYRFSNGFYNLDRLTIIKKIIPARSAEVNRIDLLSSNMPVIKKYKGIVVDGIHLYFANYRFEPAFVHEGSNNDTMDASTADLIRTIKIIAMPAHPFKF